METTGQHLSKEVDIIYDSDRTVSEAAPPKRVKPRVKRNGISKTSRKGPAVAQSKRKAPRQQGQAKKARLVAPTVKRPMTDQKRKQNMIASRRYRERKRQAAGTTNVEGDETAETVETSTAIRRKAKRDLIHEAAQAAYDKLEDALDKLQRALDMSEVSPTTLIIHPPPVPAHAGAISQTEED